MAMTRSNILLIVNNHVFQMFEVCMKYFMFPFSEEYYQVDSKWLKKLLDHCNDIKIKLIKTRSYPTEKQYFHWLWDSMSDTSYQTDIYDFIIEDKDYADMISHTEFRKLSKKEIRYIGNHFFRLIAKFASNPLDFLDIEEILKCELIKFFNEMTLHLENRALKKKNKFVGKALIDKSGFFVRFHRSIYHNPDLKYWNMNGWEDLKKYYRKVRMNYLKSSKIETFSGWFKMEYENLCSRLWENLSPEVQSSMIDFFKNLDEDDRILDRRERIRK